MESLNKDKLLAIAAGSIGVFFLASGFQTVGTNWADQSCPYQQVCLHPEWIGVGAGLIALAVFAWKRHSGPT